MKFEPTLRYVRQEDPHGCVAAVFAMLTGLTYKQAARRLHDPKRDIEEKGFCTFAAEHRLVELGYAVARKWPVTQPGNRKRRVWPPEPWAELHWCDVIPNSHSKWAHAVLMLDTGEVWDPDGSSPCKLTDYHAVNFVTAVVKV